VGFTHNIETRLEKHNLGSTPSTRPGIPWELVYQEEFNEKGMAIKRENEIKSQKSRQYIERLIKDKNG
jgi:putative endonuclease